MNHAIHALNPRGHCLLARVNLPSLSAYQPLNQHHNQHHNHESSPLRLQSIPLSKLATLANTVRA